MEGQYLAADRLADDRENLVENARGADVELIDRDRAVELGLVAGLGAQRDRHFMHVEIGRPADADRVGEDGVDILQQSLGRLFVDLNALRQTHELLGGQNPRRLPEIRVAGEIQLAVVNRGGDRSDGHQAILHPDVQLRGPEIETQVGGAVEAERSLAAQMGQQAVRLAGGIRAREVERDLPLARDAQLARHEGRGQGAMPPSPPGHRRRPAL